MLCVECDSLAVARTCGVNSLTAPALLQSAQPSMHTYRDLFAWLSSWRPISAGAWASLARLFVAAILAGAIGLKHPSQAMTVAHSTISEQD